LKGIFVILARKISGKKGNLMLEKGISLKTYGSTEHEAKAARSQVRCRHDVNK
jgi:hypothetical protein